MYQNHQSPSWNPPTQQKSSQLTPHLFDPQTQKNNPKSSFQSEQGTFERDKHEADRLQLKTETGSLTSVEQQRLNVLQAKMNDFWVQKREKASQFGHNIANISVSSPHRQNSTAQSKLPIQAKLTIGEPGDKYEREADSVAAEVVNRINSPQQKQQQAVQRQSELEEEKEELQTKLLPEIQREVMLEEGKEELQAKSMLQRLEATGGSEASMDLESAINSARGGGQSLDAGLQQSMGQAMGADFSGVKIHTDSQSDQLNKSIQARAFTTGQDVFFRQGEYNPGSRGGQELIAHELTHVVQQSGGISGSFIQCKEVDEIVNGIESVMDEGKLTKEQIINGLKKMTKSDRDDPNFAHALVEFVKKRNGTEFKIDEIQKVNVGRGKKHVSKKWKFRHYTKMKYDNLKSLAQLEGEGQTASANTNKRDWEELGNQGYVFGLIAIDGKVPNRNWLKDMKYYAEYDLKELNSVWVSGDMLTEDGRKENSYYGSGQKVIEKLSELLGFIDQNPVETLDRKFNGVLEAKVSPALLNTGEIRWQEV